MKNSMKASLEKVISKWLEDSDNHPDRPDGLACEDLAEMMANAASSVYDASHAGAIMGADSV
jgi:hypothetical protein